MDDTQETSVQNLAARPKITLAHLYPKLLNIYGDLGNIITIKKRCQDRNIDIEIVEINSGDNIDPELYDFYFIGGGQDKQQIEVSNQLQIQKTMLEIAMHLGAVFLGICGGYQLLGHYYQPKNGERLLGLGLLDAHTIAGDKRFIGNVTAKSDFLVPQTLVGFENHSGLTYIQGNTIPISKIDVGHGNNGQDLTEGARYKNVFGTYLHGSLLPKNPHFADLLIKLALEKKYNTSIKLEKLDDELELNAHKSLIAKPY